MEAVDSIMGESITLLNSQLSFLDARVALIHIPLSVYPLFVQPILQLILHNDQVEDDGQRSPSSRPWTYWHPFVNISLTPNECSLVCPRQQADAWFAPILRTLNPTLSKTATISHEDYSVIVIGGPGMDAGARVLDLSSPLALAGIPIFFITSYYCDYILVPHSARARVIHALEDRGFVFELDLTNGSEAGHMANPASPVFPSASSPFHRKNSSSSSNFDFSPPTSSGSGGGGSSTPPATSIPELQIRTFALLRKHAIQPVVDRRIRLVTCGGYKDLTPSLSDANFSEGKLALGLTKCLTTVPLPHFFALTLTDSESLSVTLDEALARTQFHNAGEDLLLGKDGPVQVPITLDLSRLPLASTGIVCGVASRVSDGMRGRIGRLAFNLSYLSTAKAGHVIVYLDELDDALEALANGGDGAGEGVGVVEA